MATQTKPTTRNIRNPQKWIGRYVRHMANWREFEYTAEYFVEEYTGKLWPISELYTPDSHEAAIIGDAYDPCYNYSETTIVTLYWQEAAKPHNAPVWEAYYAAQREALAVQKPTLTPTPASAAASAPAPERKRKNVCIATAPDGSRTFTRRTHHEYQFASLIYIPAGDKYWPEGWREIGMHHNRGNAEKYISRYSQYGREVAIVPVTREQ